MRAFLLWLALLPFPVFAQWVLLDEAVARVDAAVIYRSDVQHRLEALAKYAAATGKAAPTRDAVLRQLIDETLVAADAQARQVRVEAQDIDGAIASITAAQQLDDAQFTAALEKQGFTRASWRQQVRLQLLEMKWLRARSDDGTLPSPAELDRVRAEALAQLRARAVVELLR